MPHPSRLLAALLAVAATTASALAAQQPQRVSLTGTSFEFYNLIGTIQVEGTSGGPAAEVTFQGADGAKLSLHRDGSTVSIVFPGTDFVYAGMGANSESDMRVREDGTFGGNDRGGGRKVRIRGRGNDGLNAWAEMKILLPRGTRAEVNLGVGKVTLANVDGHIMVDTGSGDVEGSGTAGSLSVDTGSGDVTLTGHTGELSVDTGSGDIVLGKVSGGPVNLDTGSGDVRVDGLTSPSLKVDTGSGDVMVSGAAVGSIGVDTGSGDVSLGLTADITDLDVDTGSGDVTVTAPRSLGVRVEVETSSGDITTEFPLQVTRKSRDGLTGTIGNGEGTLTVDTGSGDIVLRQQS